MRKLILVAVICAALPFPLCTLIAVRATTRISSIYDVQLGMSMADVLSGLQGKYSIESSPVEENLLHYSITGGLDPRYEYEIFALNGKVASIWTDDAKSYSGDTAVVGTELFDALYAAGQPRRDKIGEAMGVREVILSAQLQKPASDSSSRTLIFNLPGEDFRLSFSNSLNGTPSLLVQRVKSLDEKAFDKLSAGPSSPK